jgi:hypothetical protein
MSECPVLAKHIETFNMNSDMNMNTNININAPHKTVVAR